MCGIFAVLSLSSFTLGSNVINKFRENAKIMNNRGDTDKQLIINNKVYLFHRRLAIMDTSSDGDQPFFKNGVFCIVNGEIYNHNELKLENLEIKYKGHSDCEVLIPLYLKYGSQFITHLRGMFSFVLYDSRKKLLLAGRDHLGMTSMYMGKDEENIYFASDMKALVGLCSNISNIEAGSLLIKNVGKEEEIFSYTKLDSWRAETDISKLIKFDESVLTEIRNKLVESVKSHLNSDVPVGVLLSGGLDSSLVAAIVNKLIKDTDVESSKKIIKTFTIGVENSSDILAADTVATFLKSNHSAYNFEADDAITVLEDVIYAIETYDITTIRASIPLYLLTTWIKEDTDIKVILSGEVADEIFAGYSYFKHAPNANELFLETKDKVSMLQKYDCLRAHKATITNTIEIRIPFGDKIVVDYAMSLNPECKMYGFGLDGEIDEKKIEKYILRKAFEGWLPDEILWRKKEQFSDGVSSEKENVINVLKQYAEKEISDKEFAERTINHPINTPNTKEGLLYYKIFNKLFKHDSCLKTVDHNTKSVACSTERGLKWLNIDENNAMNDPSGHSV
jgi:asparagine synthase (glutamine-hydrolysing)